MDNYNVFCKTAFKFKVCSDVSCNCDEIQLVWFFNNSNPILNSNPWTVNDIYILRNHIFLIINLVVVIECTHSKLWNRMQLL